MFKTVDITCTNNGTRAKADVTECRPDYLKIAIHGSHLPITLRQQNGVYVGNAAGMEFVCEASYNDIITS